MKLHCLLCLFWWSTLSLYRWLSSRRNMKDVTNDDFLLRLVTEKVLFESVNDLQAAYVKPIVTVEGKLHSLCKFPP